MEGDMVVAVPTQEIRHCSISTQKSSPSADNIFEETTHVFGNGGTMAQIQWSSEFETGIMSVDGQHQNLLGIVNKFAAAVEIGKGRRIMGDILRDLVGYTQEHFLYEESLMKEAEYSNLTLHVAQHHQLLEKVQRFQFDFNQGKRLTKDVHSFLQYWLLNHIQVDDIAFANWLAAGGVEDTTTVGS